jgi:peroxiredoxin
MQQQLNSLRDERLAFHKNDTEILGVSIDPADVQLAFVKKQNLNFSLIPDTGRNMSILYGAAQTTSELASHQTILIDKNGVIRIISKSVNSEDHGTDILAKMQALGLLKTPIENNKTVP